MSTKTIDQLPLATQGKHQASRAARLGIELTVGSRWRLGHPPSSYEETATKAERKGHWRFAARMWHLASCVSMGHNRAERYETLERIALSHACLAYK